MAIPAPGHFDNSNGGVVTVHDLTAALRCRTAVDCDFELGNVFVVRVRPSTSSPSPSRVLIDTSDFVYRFFGVVFFGFRVTSRRFDNIKFKF